MPLCFDTYRTEETHLDEHDILIRKRVCTIYSERDLWGDRAIFGGPAVIDYTVSKKLSHSLKNAYVKLGKVPLGWFSSTPEQGIFIEELPLPKPFAWKLNPPTLDKLVNCNIPEKIKKEFGIDIHLYL